MLEKLEKLLSQRRWLIFWLIFLVSLGVICFGLNQTGETWDEIPYYNGGRQYMSNLIKLDFTSLHWNANKEHPPVAKFVYGFASLPGYHLDGEHYTGGRLASAIMLSLAIALTFIFAGELFNPLIGLIASLMLITTAPFIAYGRILGMDSITTLIFLLIAISFYRFAKSEAKWKDYLVPILILGLGYATRYNIILATLFLPLAIILFASWRTNFPKWLSLVLFPIGALLVLYLIWPFLWSQPIAGMQISIGHWGQVKEWYLGVREAVLPNSYFATYFLFVTPVVLMVLAIVGLVKKEKINQKIYILGLLLVPFINSWVGIKQGGVRYLLFCFIPICILAAIGFAWLLKVIRREWGIWLMIILLVGYGVFNLVSHYPYYLDYYNELAGGSAGNYQKRLLQFGWWGEGGKRSADFLNEKAPQNARIWNDMKPDHTLDGLRDDLRMVKQGENPDYIVINTSWAWNSNFVPPDGYKIVHEEKSGGAPIVTIYQKI